MPIPFTVSSPGKVILFGEHAVVHGAPAIAASIALHTYVTVDESTTKHYVELVFPDVDLAVGWSKAELESLQPYDIDSIEEIPTVLNPDILAHAEFIADATIDSSKQFSKTAAVAFLYLYLSIQPNKTGTPVRVSTRSTLPIGAGLGSSASFSVSLAGALLRLAGKLTDDTPHDVAMQLISKWSFLGECCIHGKPSGIDNIVATQGGAVYFQRNTEIDSQGQITVKPPTVKTYSGFPELDLILTDTTVPRLTSELVARVHKIKDTWPAVFNHLMGAFAEIVKEADALLKASPADPDFVSKLSELADLNHGLLVTVSVSHPSLERVREVSAGIGLGSTKLTGAGGGGCAITIAKDFDSTHPERGIEHFRKQLGPEYSVFETKLGVRGVGYADGTAADEKGLSELDWKFW